MWAPDGYFSWSDVVDAFFGTSRDILSLVCKGGQPNYTTDGHPYLAHTAEFYLKNNGFSDSYAEAELIVGITTTMLLVSFLEEYPPVLFNLEGKIFRANEVIFGHRDQLELCYYDWPVKGASQFHGFFKSQKDGQFDTDALLDRFAFIDSRTGEIRYKNGGKNYLLNGICLDQANTEIVISLVKKLSGFVICWPRLPEGQALRDFLACIEANEDFTRALNHEFGPPSSQSAHSKPKAKQKKLGRPSKRDEAARAYWSHFPEGHSTLGKSWKEALATVNDAIKAPISEDTLKRAVEDTQ